MKPMHDLHVHTNLSACAIKDSATVDNYIKIARERGIKVLGFSNHMWDSKVDGANDWYKIQNFEHIIKIREEIPKKIDAPKILIGCETDFDANSVLGISEETAKKLDYVLVPHSHTHFSNIMPKEIRFDFEKHGEFLYNSFLRLTAHPLSKYITSIVHPFAAIGLAAHFDEILSFVTDAQLEECFNSAKEKGIAIEINTRVFGETSEENLPYCQFMRMIKIAKKCGCKFTFGSDSHRPESYRYFHYADLITDLAGITDDDILKVFKRTGE